MSTEIENALRTDLSRRAETVVASEELKWAILDRLDAERSDEVRRRRRVLAMVAAAAAVVVVLVGVAVLRDRDESPQPLGPKGLNAELLDQMPVGAAPNVPFRGDRNSVTSPDGTRTTIGSDVELLGRSGRNLLTFGDDGYYLVPEVGLPDNLTGPNPGLYAFSPDGLTFYSSGTLVDLATRQERGTMPMPTNTSGRYTTHWTAAGIVVLSEESVGFVPMQGAPVAVPELALPTEVEFAIGSDRVLVTPSGGCPYVAQLLSDGRLDTVLERCEGDLMSLSRDGTTGLLGQPNDSPDPPGIATVTGLLDIDSGSVTDLPGLAALDEFPVDVRWGDDLFSLTWENGHDVLLAYYVERNPKVPLSGTLRIVRCRTSSETCEVIPGTLEPPIHPHTVFGRGIGD